MGWWGWVGVWGAGGVGGWCGSVGGGGVMGVGWICGGGWLGLWWWCCWVYHWSYFTFGEKMTMAGVLRKYIWFSLPIPKIKFDSSPQGKMFQCSYFRSFMKLVNFSRTENFVKFNFVSTPRKITFP